MLSERNILYDCIDTKYPEQEKVDLWLLRAGGKEIHSDFSMALAFLLDMMKTFWNLIVMMVSQPL